MGQEKDPFIDPKVGSGSGLANGLDTETITKTVSSGSIAKLGSGTAQT